MKQHAIDAITQGLKDGGAQAVYNFPGFMSHDIAQGIEPYEISLNERVAYAEAFGSAVAGKRTVVSFKNVGLNIASDAFLHSVIAGVRAGLVVVVTDDIEVLGSQESQDSRHYYDIFGGLWFEPSSVQQAYDFAVTAFKLSEQYDTPVVIRLTNAYFDLKEDFARGSHKTTMPPLPNITPEKYVIHPCHFTSQAQRLQKKQKAIQKWAETSGAALLKKHSRLVIRCGAASYETDRDVDVLQANTLPLPIGTIEAALDIYDEISVAEQGDQFVAEKVRSLSAKKEIMTEPQMPKGTRVKFSKWDRYEKFFKALTQTKGDCIVVSDITQFTVDSLDTVDIALSLGVAVATGIGFSKASSNFTFCLAGDCSLLHEGIGIVREAINREVRLGIVIFDNHASWCTGGQSPIGDIYDLPRSTAIRTHSLSYESSSQSDIAEKLRAMQTYEGVSVLYLQVPLGKLTR